MQYHIGRISSYRKQSGSIQVTIKDFNGRKTTNYFIPISKSKTRKSSRADEPSFKLKDIVCVYKSDLGEAIALSHRLPAKVTSLTTTEDHIRSSTAQIEIYGLREEETYTIAFGTDNILSQSMGDEPEVEIYLTLDKNEPHLVTGVYTSFEEG